MNGRHEGRLLVVDDDEEGRLSLELVFRRSGFQVAPAGTVAEALAEAEREAPDLALVDLRLPDGSGTDLLVALRERDPDLPVIVLTGYASMDSALAALNRGAVAYMRKPFDVQSLLAAARQHLEKRRLVLENRRLVAEVQRELEQKRRAEAEWTLLRAAVEAAAEAIVVTDRVGSVRFVNPAFEKTTGYSRDEVVGRDLHLLDSGEHGPEYFAALRAELKERGIWSGALVSRRKDGSLYHEECTISPVRGEDGEASSFVYVRRDVTEKLRFQAVAEAVNTTNNIGAVFDGLRHEIGNPINSAQMTLRMLRRDFARHEPERVTEFLDRAIAELGRVAFLLHSLRSFNAFEEVEAVPLDVGGFLEGFVRMARRDCERRGVSLGVTVADGVPAVVADPRALQQVLLNVLTNALDSLSDADAASPAVRIEARPEGRDVVILVSDNGGGMTDEVQSTLFRPFLSTKPRGTGLGLVISRRLMSQMGGAITVASDAGVGTRVELRLPDARGAR